MGEYAKYRGQSVKIGTCEDMYYLRFSQRNDVKKESGSLDPSDLATMAQIRFRFPFPDEDTTNPGEFQDYKKGLWIPSLSAPEGVDHYKVQFVASAGYNICLPCPESKEAKANPYHVHRNGFSGAVKLVQQKYVDGQLWAVCECGGCGSKWRCDEESGERLILACRAEADNLERRNAGNPKYWHDVADRIATGYAMNKLPNA